MIKNYFKIAWRNLVKNKVYSFINVFGLALGISCASLIFLWAEDELSFDSHNAKKENLYQLKINADFGGNLVTISSTPRPMAEAVKNEIPGIVNASRVSDYERSLLFSIDNRAFNSDGHFVDASLFDMFSFNFVEGNARNPFPQLYSIILTESAAKRFFGTQSNIVGKGLRVNVDKNYIVTGVIKDMPKNSTLQFDWLAPFQIIIAENEDRFKKSDAEWSSYSPLTFVELDKKAKVEIVNKALKDFISRKMSSEKSETFLFPLAKWHLYDDFANGKPTGSGAISLVNKLSAIAIIIMLISCINFMNLATANSQKRAKETGVRKVMGAVKGKLVLQFMAEALFMSLLATLVAILITIWALPIFNQLMQKQLSIQLLNPFHLIAFLSIGIISGLLAGSYPSFYLSSFNSISILKGMKSKAGSAENIRKGLVVFQFVASVVFIICTAIIYQQIQFVQNRDIGFIKDNLVEIDMQHNIQSSFSAIKNKLLQTGFVENIAMSDHSTLNEGDMDGRFKWQNKSEDNKVAIAYRNVSPEFMTTSGMKIVSGRDFINEASDNNNVIINETLAKMMGDENVVGKIIQSPRRNKPGVFTDMKVVGVIKDYVFGNVYGSPDPTIFFCKPAENSNLIYIKLKQQAYLENALGKIGDVLKSNNPAYPYEYKFMDDQFNKLFFNELLVGKVAGIFAVLAIIISCLGLFGLATYIAEQRTKEIGIRKVLGASVNNLWQLLIKDFVILVIISCLIAAPIAYYFMNEWLQKYTYRTDISWWIFVAAGGAALLITLLTVSFQAIKAAVANPVKSLRTE